MKFTRILSLILAVLLMACTFVACDMNKDADPTTDDGADQKAEPITLNVVESSYTGYTIIRDYKASGTVLAAVASMQSSFADYLGCEIQVQECYNDREEAEDIVTKLEILVGTTNRPETAQVADGLKTNDYRIDIVGEKIVIVGGSDEATEKAISKFMIGFVQAQGNKNEVKQEIKQNLSVYKNLPDEDANKKYDVSIDTFSSYGKYSYGKATMGGARLDSYVVVYPRAGEMAESNQAFAEEIQSYVNKQAGYSVSVKKDVAIVRADYMILIGDTSFTDETLANSLGDDEYYIALTATETTLADGTKVPGAVLTILYGADAEEAAMEAFKRIMPTSSTQIDFNMCIGFVETNMANPPAAN